MVKIDIFLSNQAQITWSNFRKLKFKGGSDLVKGKELADHTVDLVLPSLYAKFLLLCLVPL